MVESNGVAVGVEDPGVASGGANYRDNHVADTDPKADPPAPLEPGTATPGELVSGHVLSLGGAHMK